MELRPRDHLRPRLHVFRREQFVRGHADEGAVRLDLPEDLLHPAAAAADIVAVHLVTDIEVGICVPRTDELGALVPVVGPGLVGEHHVRRVLLLLEKALLAAIGQESYRTGRLQSVHSALEAAALLECRVGLKGHLHGGIESSQPWGDPGSRRDEIDAPEEGGFPCHPVESHESAHGSADHHVDLLNPEVLPQQVEGNHCVMDGDPREIQVIRLAGPWIGLGRAGRSAGGAQHVGADDEELFGVEQFPGSYQGRPPLPFRIGRRRQGVEQPYYFLVLRITRRRGVVDHFEVVDAPPGFERERSFVAVLVSYHHSGLRGVKVYPFALSCSISSGRWL